MGVMTEIRRFIIDNFLFGKDEGMIEDNGSFLEKGLIDSTGILELVAFVEEKFGIRVPDEDLVPDNFDSVSNLAGYIDRKKTDGK